MTDPDWYGTRVVCEKCGGTFTNTTKHMRQKLCRECRRKT